MTATETIMLRAGLDERTAEQYESAAADSVRYYLGYKTTEGLDKFTPVIADLAIVYARRDRAISTADSTGTAGVKKESFSEGQVSKTLEYATATDITAEYDAQADRILAGLARYRRARVVRDHDTDTE